MRFINFCNKYCYKKKLFKEIFNKSVIGLKKAPSEIDFLKNLLILAKSWIF